MQLKKIEIKGFKSFAEKTTLEFPAGITAIVGPNGSGKSNVTEAIRWAMGEQSAKSLRGGKMQDVIFSGTSTRKPVNIAEVSLFFDNHDRFLPIDNEEVMVTRRLYRSGDSDYFINQSACRMRDVLDLFTDSGLGKESFSIISQGQVEEVFNSKPEDRRAIFEEAAGVLKYKKRKQQAEAKLSQTTDNLERIRDILGELTKQLLPLKKQSETATEYQRLEKEFSVLDLSVTVQTIQHFQEKWTSEKRKAKSVAEKQHEIDQQVKHTETSSSYLEEEIRKVEKEIEKIQSAVIVLIREEEQMTGELNLQSERSKYSSENRTKNMLVKEKTIRELSALEERKKTTLLQLDRFEKKAKEKEKEIDDLRNKLRTLKDGGEESMEELRALYIDQMQRQTSVKNDYSHTEKSLSRLTPQLSRIEEMLEELTQSLASIEIEIQKDTERKEEIKNDITSCLGEYRSYQEEYEQLQHSVTKQEKDWNKIKESIQKNIFQKKHLEEWQENYSGLYAGVRQVMQNKQELKGIIGVAAELLKVSPSFEIALETALGSAGQFIAVTNEEAAKKAIRFLKQKKAGRATFLPLTTVQSRSLPSNILKVIEGTEGFLGVAAQLVEYDPTLTPLIENLLGTTLIADSLDAALKIAKKVSYRYKIVSIQGEVVNAGGSLTGGAAKQNRGASLLSVKNTLTRLREENKALSDQEIEHRKLVTESTEKLLRVQQKLEEIRTKGEEYRLQEQRIVSVAERNTEKQKQLKKELAATSYEQQTIQKEKQALHSQLAASLKEQKGTEQRLLQIRAKIDSRNNDSKLKKKATLQMEELLDKMREEAGKIREQMILLEQENKGLETQKRQLNLLMEDAEKEIEEAENARASLQPESMKQKIDEISLKRKQHEEKLAEKNQEKKEKEQQLTEYRKQLGEYQITQQATAKKQSDVAVAISKLEVELDHQLNYLVETYRISFERAVEQVSGLEDLSLGKERLKDLSEQIKRLGPINLEAIEEYKSVSERHDHLEAQQQDMLEAQKQLCDTMEEMDEEVKVRFETTFRDIQEKFARIFPQMFGGGQAQLTLTDPDHLLTSGVDISAQPPGKKLQNLSLLSGGERSLTAIALLFSIIQVKPVPFCILDEAEAALDDANIARFGTFLQSFKGEPQFIVITHRKGTMERADTLYGVTMQEKGVSKLLSVRLNREEEKETSIS